MMPAEEFWEVVLPNSGSNRCSSDASHSGSGSGVATSAVGLGARTQLTAVESRNTNGFTPPFATVSIAFKPTLIRVFFFPSFFLLSRGIPEAPGAWGPLRANWGGDRRRPAHLGSLRRGHEGGPRRAEGVHPPPLRYSCPLTSWARWFRRRGGGLEAVRGPCPTEVFW